MKYLRNAMFLILLFVMAFSSSTFAVDNPSSWAEGSINDLKALGILDDSMFTNYSEFTTRADFAYLGVKLYELYTGKVAEIGNVSFNDTENEWVLKAKRLGIVNGYNDGTFRPNQLIKRDELAALFVNVFKASDIQYMTYSGEIFSDDGQIASWAKEAVYIAKANGIISGVGENRFDAKSNATMQQALLMFNNGIEVINDQQTDVTPEPTTEAPFVDVNSNHYDSINDCLTFEIELTDYLGLDIKVAYEKLKTMYAEDVTLLEFPGAGYISISGKFGQVAAMRCAEENLIEEVWIGFNSYASKPIDISMREELVNGIHVNQGVDALMIAMGIESKDLVTSRRIQSTFDVIGYRTQTVNVEFTQDVRSIFGLSFSSR